jgi:hypothetical protein
VGESITYDYRIVNTGDVPYFAGGQYNRYYRVVLPDGSADSSDLLYDVFDFQAYEITNGVFTPSVPGTYVLELEIGPPQDYDATDDTARVEIVVIGGLAP